MAETPNTVGNKRRARKKDVQKFYAVARGHVPGVYENLADAERTVTKYSNCLWRSFTSIEAARKWLRKNAKPAASQDRPTVQPQVQPTLEAHNGRPVQEEPSAQDEQSPLEQTPSQPGVKQEGTQEDEPSPAQENNLPQNGPEDDSITHHVTTEIATADAHLPPSAQDQRPQTETQVQDHAPPVAEQESTISQAALPPVLDSGAHDNHSTPNFQIPSSQPTMPAAGKQAFIGTPQMAPKRPVSFTVAQQPRFRGSEQMTNTPDHPQAMSVPRPEVAQPRPSQEASTPAPIYGLQRGTWIFVPDTQGPPGIAPEVQSASRYTATIPPADYLPRSSAPEMHPAYRSQGWDGERTPSRVYDDRDLPHHAQTERPRSPRPWYQPYDRDLDLLDSYRPSQKRARSSSRESDKMERRSRRDERDEMSGKRQREPESEPARKRQRVTEDCRHPLLRSLDFRRDSPRRERTREDDEHLINDHDGDALEISSSQAEDLLRPDSLELSQAQPVNSAQLISPPATSRPQVSRPPSRPASAAAVQQQPVPDSLLDRTRLLLYHQLCRRLQLHIPPTSDISVARALLRHKLVSLFDHGEQPFDAQSWGVICEFARTQGRKSLDSEPEMSRIAARKEFDVNFVSGVGDGWSGLSDSDVDRILSGRVSKVAVERKYREWRERMGETVQREEARQKMSGPTEAAPAKRSKGWPKGRLRKQAEAVAVEQPAAGQTPEQIAARKILPAKRPRGWPKGKPRGPRKQTAAEPAQSEEPMPGQSAAPSAAVPLDVLESTAARVLRNGKFVGEGSVEA